MLRPGPPFFEATCLTSNLVGQVCGGIWLGGLTLPLRWVTAEPFSFGNWGPFEPFGNGDRVRIDEFRDRDGHPDLTWQNTMDGRVAVWLMNGLARISGMLLSPSQVADTNWHIVGPP
jgi:hypothetical protein